MCRLYQAFSVDLLVLDCKDVKGGLCGNPASQEHQQPCSREPEGGMDWQRQGFEKIEE